MTFILRQLFFFFLLITSSVFGQQYSAPLDIKMLLSGTFGELRGNHFHSGIDIKTDGIEGQKVYAIAEGYVSRIKVSAWGYGKALYINHPDGRTSVYAHLQKFNGRIDSIVKVEHYKKEKFELNFYPNKNAIKIRKGEVIALSGNSGSSAGAHLHFEIRNTKTEHPINPLSFGFDIADNIAPTLKKVKIYTFENSSIDGSAKNKIYNLKKNNNTYQLDKTPTIFGDFALGIYTYDKLNGTHNKNGVYSIKLTIDSTLIYAFKVDKLNFSTSRYINAHIDFTEKKESKNKYHRCYKLPHNKLSNYTTLIGDGIISFDDNDLHLIKLEVADIFGNISNLTFKVQATKTATEKTVIKTVAAGKEFSFFKPNIFKAPNFELHMEANSLYEPLNFMYNTEDSVESIFGVVHQVHTDKIPVHKKYVLSIKASIPSRIDDKVYIAKKDKNNNFWYMGGSWRNGFLRTKVREFGDFCIVADTIQPEIKGVNIYPGKTFNTQTTIKCTINDKQSGIKSYRAELDGKWILMDYDYKRKLLRFDIENTITKGEHAFTLEVVDNMGNSTNYKATFTQ
jgi:hypothetical protein